MSLRLICILSILFVLTGCGNSSDASLKKEGIDYKVETEKYASNASVDVSEKTIKVFEEEERYKKYLREIMMINSVPEVDFKTRLVLFIFHGVSHSLDHNIKVTDVVEYPDYIQVHYDNIKYNLYNTAFGGAFSIVSIPKTEKAIHFIETKTLVTRP